MKKLVSVAIALFLVAGFGGKALAEESMCESVEKHIKTARTYGGEGKARERASNLLLAHRYMARTISNADLIRCVLKGVNDPKYIRTQSLEAGIPKHTVDSVIPDTKASGKMARMRPKSSAAYKKTARAFSSPPVPMQAMEDTAPVQTALVPAAAGMKREESCDTISPWTWCAE